MNTLQSVKILDYKNNMLRFEVGFTKKSRWLFFHWSQRFKTVFITRVIDNRPTVPCLSVDMKDMHKILGDDLTRTVLIATELEFIRYIKKHFPEIKAYMTSDHFYFFINEMAKSDWYLEDIPGFLKKDFITFIHGKTLTSAPDGRSIIHQKDMKRYRDKLLRDGIDYPVQFNNE